MQAPIAGASSTAVFAMVPVGSRYEAAPVAGGAHFLEHMLFKGTKRRPSAQQISRILDSVGAEFNAFTSKEYTGYFVKVSSNFADRAVDLLADMLFDSTLSSEEFERERGVIIEEIRMYEDMPMRHVHDLIDESLYPDQRLGRNIAGTEKSINEMKLTDLRSFWKQHYQADNMVVVIAGATDGLAELVAKHFGKRRSGARKGSFQKMQKKSRQPIVQTKETDQAHVVLAYPALPYGHAGESAAAVLRTVMGGTMSSRLFTEVREKRGLAYSVSAGVDKFRDVGSFQVYAGLDRTRLQEALKVIARELKKVSEKGISATELSEAKSNIRGRITLKLENSTELASWYARGFLFYPDPWTPEQFLRRIEGVKLSDVAAVAKRFIKNSQMGVACIGPYSESEFTTMLRRAFS